jgi:SNF2 family DNA or RNA helicase
MKFLNSSLRDYVNHHSTEKNRKKLHDSELLKLTVTPNFFDGVIEEHNIYYTQVKLVNNKIKGAECTCPNNQAGLCHHLILTIFEADKKVSFDLVETKTTENQRFNATSENFDFPTNREFVFDQFELSEVNDAFINHFSLQTYAESIKPSHCDARELSVNHGVFYNTTSYWDNSLVQVDYFPEQQKLKLLCSCAKIKKKMCEHQSAFMHILLVNQEIRLYFDANLRARKLLSHAQKFGLENEEDLDAYFSFERKNNTNVIVAKRKDLIAIDPSFDRKYQAEFLPEERSSLLPKKANASQTVKGLVFSQSRYTENFYIHLFEANTSKEGKIKNPLKELNPIHELERYDDVESIRFLSSLSLFKDRYDTSLTNEEKLKGLRILAKNPLQLPFYYHDTKQSENITVQSVKEIKIQAVNHSYISFHVKENQQFFEILAYLYVNDKKYNLRAVKLRYDFIFHIDNTFYLIDNPYYIKLFKFLKQYQFKLSIHQSKFEEFKTKYLSHLEKNVEINYTFIKPANKKQLKEKAFDEEPIKTVYIEESDGYILLTPSVRYGHLEIPILGLKQINEKDEDGNWYHVERDKHLEHNFAGLLIRQHPDFELQLGQFDYFYLHKQDFLDSGWFIDVFETWKNNDINVFGFNKIKNNNLSAQKMSVNVMVNRGLDWFDTSIKIKFGKEEISLKQVQKALKNATKFIPLGDGTMGLMPEEWIEKFAKYFRSAELVDGNLRTSKINFSAIDHLYEHEVLSKEVSEELAYLKSKIANFKTIHEVAIPKGLKTELREYQKQGLNWLNFLDEFHFGGCLADDMGLGKTVQIIAFILSQKEKRKTGTNLIVVPTSLIFNWQREVEKFAPSLKIKTIYGVNRSKTTDDFSSFDIVLTSYGTMMADISVLKNYVFHYIFLDESQAIKNPESQRYKAVRLLQAKNRIVLTGTPIENNTFDLFAQLSFVNPGLFINQNRFKEEFSVPIDKFKDSKRAQELQQKINPFVLRRTKKQVATELPEKTEMILYCEMEEEQRKVYDSYRQEIRELLLKPKHNDDPGSKNMLVLQGLTKLRQICNTPALLADSVGYGSSSAKMTVLLEEIETKSQQHKLLIFSQFVGMLDLIRLELDKRQISHEYLTGQTKDREERVHNFQNDNEIRVFLISLKAGGTGLNLTEADYVYLVDPWWNPAVENQAIDRCYRIGQKKNVVAVRLITPGTIEEKIMLLQNDKRELAEDIIKTDQSVLKSLSPKELMGLFE